MNWLLTYGVGATTVATAGTPAPSEPDCPLFRAGGAEETNSASSPSASSSSSSADAFSLSTSEQQSPSTSTSALCFGAGGTGRLWWSSSKALARASKIHEEEEDAQQAAASVAPRGHVVGRHLRRMSRRLRRARAANKETPAAPLLRGAVDDTARERGEAVASAVAHCKETLRRGTLPRRRLPPPLSSPSLDLWLRDRQDEIIASVAAHCDDARRPPPVAVFPTALARHGPCTRLPYIQVGRRYESAAAPAAPTGTPPSQVNGVSSRETETRGGCSELEFLETFDGDEELIDRHFITVQNLNDDSQAVSAFMSALVFTRTLHREDTRKLHGMDYTGNQLRTTPSFPTICFEKDEGRRQ